VDLNLALTFASLLFASFLVMKAVSWWQCPPARRPPAAAFWLSPLFSVDSVPRIRPVSGPLLLRLTGRLGWMGLSLAAGYALAPWLRARAPQWTWAYLAMPLVPLYGGFASTVLQLLNAPLGAIPPDHHRHPWAASSVSDFWGRRWNTWLSDWFRQIFFHPLRRHPVAGAFVTFLFSGLWHEALISAPFYFWTGIPVFGLLTAYFLLQFVAMVVERWLPRPARRALVYLVVALACPLFVNRAMLSVVLLWPTSGG